MAAKVAQEAAAVTAKVGQKAAAPKVQKAAAAKAAQKAAVGVPFTFLKRLQEMARKSRGNTSRNP